MRFIVSGSSGFIGRNTVKELLRSNNEVVAVTTNTNISDEAMRCLDGAKILVISSLTDLSHKIMDSSVIIHCAWENVHDILNKSHFNHAKEQISFLENVSKSAPRKIVITGSCYEFGLKEGAVSIADNTAPNSPYAKAKDYVHKEASKLFKVKSNIEFTWARLFYVYGEGQHEKSIYMQLTQAIKNKNKIFNMSSGSQLYDYMEISEVAKSLSILATRKSPEVVHVCKGYPIKLKSLVEELIFKENSKMKLRLGYFPDRESDSKALWGAESFSSQMQSSNIEI